MMPCQLWLMSTHLPQHRMAASRPVGQGNCIGRLTDWTSLFCLFIHGNSDITKNDLYSRCPKRAYYFKIHTLPAGPKSVNHTAFSVEVTTNVIGDDPHHCRAHGVSLLLCLCRSNSEWSPFAPYRLSRVCLKELVADQTRFRVPTP